MSYFFNSYEREYSAQHGQQVDDFKRQRALLERNQIEEELRVLKGRLAQMEQEKLRDEWRSQAFQDNQRQALQQNHQFSTYYQGQAQQMPSKFSICENCFEYGHATWECITSYYEMISPTNCYNQPLDYQFQNEHEYGWNDHNFSHWNNERECTQLNFESNLNCQVLNNVSSQPHGKNIRELEDEFLKNFEFDKSNEVERITYERLIHIRLDEQGLETQRNNEDCDNCCSFTTTQNSFETNDNGKKEDALVFVGEDEVEQLEIEQLNENTTLLDIAPKSDNQTLGKNPNPLSNDESVLLFSSPLDAYD